MKAVPSKSMDESQKRGADLVALEEQLRQL
jgi:hypothetical protein